MERKQYTDEEIDELGRKALARHKITVYVLVYKTKHDDSISVYGSLKSAQHAARDLMGNRASATWDQSDLNRVEGCKDFDETLALFNEIEQNVSYGETIEILERVVGA